MLGNVPWSGLVDNRKINITKVYYKTPRAMWRFYGYYGGFNLVGNLSTYGQYADDSTFEVVPAWQNKLQAMTYKDNLYTRVSHFSYDVRNNRVRLFPTPGSELKKLWFEFTIPKENMFDVGKGLNTLSTGEGITRTTVGGINNIPEGKNHRC